MPSIRFERHVESFVETLERHGAVVLLEGEYRRRPARLRVQLDGEVMRCLLYLWTITGGGNNRSPNERRIQITNADEFRLEPGARTIIGGFSPDEEVWCFWDPLSHVRFSAGSPSFQVHIDTLTAAAADGIATQRREVRNGEETIIAVHPDALASYVIHAREWHGTEVPGDELADLLEATEDEIIGFVEDADNLPEAQRRERVVEVVRTYRDARFRPNVLRAYNYKCAIAQTSLKLVEAAHIIPVAHARGTDDVTNGLALAVQHHRAYDAGLIGIRGDHRIVVNPERVQHLRDEHLADGLDDLIRTLDRQTITLPNVIEVRPDPARLRLAMEIRGFPTQLIA